ncbi:MAG: tail fiber domain-containing protein [Bacteroidales bacterium]|nr:tail fiber domain-containing protein [Bacteroidales bacterium]MBN2821038.1 tail fiber domain-containing protein [Bacteroidales bacterium]
MVGSTWILSSYNQRIGILTTPSSTYPLTVNGNVYFQNNSYAGIKINQGYYTRVIVPTVDLKCQVGTIDLAFDQMWATGFYIKSDKRTKENIKNITGALEKISQIQGISYDIKPEYVFNDSISKYDTKYREKLDKERKNKLGFVAQDLNIIIPEAVIYDDSTDIYGVNYIAIIPILVEALKEQQAEIEILKSDNIKKLKSTEESEEALVTSEEAWLGACKPNPFNEEATISYNLPSTINKANFYIYDLQGKQIKNIEITDRYESFVKIQSNELSPGMYKFALIADGSIIGTDTMIITN